MNVVMQRVHTTVTVINIFSSYHEGLNTSRSVISESTYKNLQIFTKNYCTFFYLKVKNYKFCFAVAGMTFQKLMPLKTRPFWSVQIY